jgi:hypothetical protein
MSEVLCVLASWLLTVTGESATTMTIYWVEKLAYQARALEYREQS